jgi:hypothetical protein
MDAGCLHACMIEHGVCVNEWLQMSHVREFTFGLWLRPISITAVTTTIVIVIVIIIIIFI